MQNIPLQGVPSQTVKVILANQNCQIYVYQKQENIYVDMNVDGVDIVTGVIARDVVPIVCREYAGFLGNLLFDDSQGQSDPFYLGLGTRFCLIYLTEDEYALISN